LTPKRGKYENTGELQYAEPESEQESESEPEQQSEPESE
jgi:hypothetical protein